MMTQKMDRPYIFTLTVCASLMVAFSVMQTAAQDVDQNAVVRGVVRTLNAATLSTDIRGKVINLKFREGERFSKGDILAEFDCRAQRAKLAEVKALEAEKEIRLKGAQYLQRLKAGSVQDIQIASAQFEQVKANIEFMKTNLDGCLLKAPFDGVVSERHVRENELPANGAPIISIVDIRNPEIELIVPSNWVSKIAPGEEFTFKIDETGETLKAILRRIAPIVDPVSQTIKIYASFVKQDANVLPGMSGNATFNLDRQ